MSSSIVPASQVPRAELTSYLVGQGYAPEIVAWKYFDDSFNQGQNRGWAWLKDGAVAGFIGLLPFEIARGSGSDSQRLPASWLCGWSVADYENNRGAGVRLFKRALQEGTHLVLGGNGNSLSLMERMASRTRHDADIEFRLFLRAGAVLERVAQRVPAARILSRSPLAKIALPRKKSAASTKVAVQEGVTSAIAPLLQDVSGEAWRAVYDHKYLQWFIGRCPILNSWTVAGEDAAAVVWHPKQSAQVWRAAIWAREGADVGAVVGAAVAQVLARGGSEISILTSPEETSQCEILRARGFSTTPTRRPLFVFDGPQPQVQIEELRGLNFIAADLAYRF